jgi:UMF1 family MFS transporter
MGNRPLIGWALYDWASSAFATVILTFVFAAYFTRRVAADAESGTQLWGMAVSIAGAAIAVFGPFLGAVADHMGRSKLWIAVFTAVCVVATALLWFVEPSPNYTGLGLLLVALGIVGSEFATIFYNAMLPRLAEPERMGRWSGWSWSAGYVGGLGCLIAALVLFVKTDPWLPLDRNAYAHVRATSLLAAGWYFVFALPFFWMTPDVGVRKPFGRALEDGLRQLRDTFRSLTRFRHIIWFLIAHMIYIDGLGALFVFGGVYAAGTFNMTEQEVLTFGIALNGSAGLGALAFSWVDDWIGSKRTILVSLVGLIVFVGSLLLIESEPLFWALGVCLGLFVGPVQAASRSFLARIAPAKLRNEAFGFYAFSGKATSFLAPLLVGWLTGYAASQRVGMSVIIVFLLLGFLLMLSIPERKDAAL